MDEGKKGGFTNADVSFDYIHSGSFISNYVTPVMRVMHGAGVHDVVTLKALKTYSPPCAEIRDLMSPRVAEIVKNATMEDCCFRF